MKIGVYGSAAGDFSDEIKKKAREIGRQIAKKGHILITGGCLGLPYEAVLGAYEIRGKCIGFSPALTKKEHVGLYNLPTKGFSELIFVPEDYVYAKSPMACKKYRNISSVLEIDSAIFIAGETGTMNEFTNAYDFGKKIGVLEGSGGISDNAIKELLKVLTKKTGAKIIFDSNPVSLVNKITLL